MSKKKRNQQKNKQEDLENASVMSIASDGSDSTYAKLVEFAANRHSALDRMNEAIEQLTEKRPETRIKALKVIIDCLRSFYFGINDDWSYHDTFASGIEFILKKGRPADQTLATVALSLCCLQAEQLTITTWLETFYPILEPITRNASSSCAFRASSCLLLAIFQYLTEQTDLVSHQDLLHNFQNIFKGSCMKGDGKAPILEPPVVELHLKAIQSWSLVFCSLNGSQTSSIASSVFPTIINLLQASNVDIRISAGGLASLVFEKIRANDEPRYKGPYYTQIIELLSELSTDSTKARSKQDRKKQRHSCRDLIESISHQQLVDSTVNFGHERLNLLGHAQLTVYNVICDLLCGGINIHLRDNPAIRFLFDLGDPVEFDHLSDTRSAKQERLKAQSIACKARTNKMNVLHDKRSHAVIFHD